MKSSRNRELCVSPISPGRWFTGLAWTFIVLQSALLAWSAWIHSPTVDEVAYLPAGISHWQVGDFKLARVSPPLVRLCAAVPVILFGKPLTEWNEVPVGPGSRPEWVAGPRFVELNGSRAFWLFALGRWGCLPFALLGAMVCWRWAREAYGELSGLIAVWLWCFCPNILGHGALMTPDVGGAATGALAGYLYWRWLRLPGGWRAAGAGAALGLAMLARTTWIVLIPLWIIGWIACLMRPPARIEPKIGRSRWGIVGVLAIALYVVNLGYAFTGSFERLLRYTFVSRALTGDSVGGPGNRFAETWIGNLPVPLPRDYVLGMDLQQRDFEGKRWSFLGGTSRNGGWWYYYVYGLAVKLPLGTLGLLGLAVALSFRRGFRREWLTEAVLLTTLVIVLLAVSSQMKFSHHVRYVYGALPFLFVWVSGIARELFWERRALAIGTGILLAGQAASSLAVYPHSLSYVNELAGGPGNGYQHLVDSNVDWGQDLLLLRDWVREHRESHPLFLAYFGEVNPKQAGIEFKLPPMANDQCLESRDAAGLAPGWYAVSVTLLQGRPYHICLPDGTQRDVPQDAFACFRKLEPVDHVGYSILIYHIDEEADR